ncbi:MAG: alpha-glucosidase/alpha-galactosidase [Clostridia bacterium]|nr:alpha-glucosidase/alpha-galactosidase [Clostridia bacterium]
MKITFLGAGSTVFAKNVLGDCMLAEGLPSSFEIALLDIDGERLDDSFVLISALRDKYKPAVTVKKYLATDEKQLEEAFTGADYVINAIQVGGYEPCTVTDFEIPKKYGLRQTIGDTLGIGGIFRGLRTIPVMKKYAEVMERVCPNTLFLNYTNPMSILTGYMLQNTKIKTVGLCHSCQVVISAINAHLQVPELEDVKFTLAGINHMCWLLSLQDKDGNDLYPLFKEKFNEVKPKWDLVRLEMMNRFGYYNTESSEHTSEYHPYFIKKDHPELIEKFNIPLDEYPRRCVNQIRDWKELREKIMQPENVNHERSREYGSHIIEACETGKPLKIYGNVMNNGLITNLPANACVEVPIMVDENGLNPCVVGDLPDQLAGLNMTHIAVHNMTIKAAVTLEKKYIYMAAYLDPHTRDQLTFDEIKNLCDDLIEAHGDWLPKFH